MVTSGKFAKKLSNVLGRPFGTVQDYAHYLRKDNLLTTGGRGPAAADITPRDGVNWLTALCSSEASTVAGEVAKKTLKTPLEQQPQIQGYPSDNLSFLKAPTVAALLTALLDDETAGRLEHVHLLVEFHVGGGIVDLAASHQTEGWRVQMRFCRRFGSGPIETRRRVDGERSIKSDCTTINRITRKTFIELAKALSDKTEA